MLMQLHHPHIVQFYGVSYHNQHYYIVQELCKGSMYDILTHQLDVVGEPRNGFDLNDMSIMLEWCIGIAKGLSFMHAKSIVHRDLKPQNILIDRSRSGIPKICDFGLSRMYDSIQGRKTKGGGTAAYLAPEVIGPKLMVEVATTVDVFAFAVTVWWMLHRSDPYPNLSEPQILLNVYQNGLRPTISDKCPLRIKALIMDCWLENPSKRPTMIEVLQRLTDIKLLKHTYQTTVLPLNTENTKVVEEKQ
jgi:serine/threonine protein kinase